MKRTQIPAWFLGARVQLAALAFALAVNAVLSPGFLEIALRDGRLIGSPIDILNRGAPVALLALGMSLVIATRGIDLSVGAVIAIAGAASASALDGGASWQIAVAIGLGAGLLCGLWNGVLVAILGIQPIVATLILMVAGRGLAQLITDGRVLTFLDPAFAAIGSGVAFGIPIPALIAPCAAAALIAIVRGGALGLFVEALGVNPRAAKLAGVNTTGVLIGVYAISGVLTAAAGLIIAADIKGADANNAGLWLELDAILAAVIGGASLYGGRFSLSLALIGAYILQTVKTGILRSGMPAEYTLIAMAAVVAALLVAQSPAVASRLAQRRATS